MDYISYDNLSICMVIYISVLSFFIIKYSHKNFERESSGNKWIFELYFTVLSAMLLFLTNHILLVFSGFLLVSLGLHNLLLSFPERERAKYAAWKKFYLSRLGDISFLIAVFFFYQSFGTFYLREAMEIAKSIPQEKMMEVFLWPSFFFALAALIKSAQFPFHFWLPETIEAPTPVSAVMHAGIINAGGFLLVKFHFLYPERNPVLWMILISGSITVWIGGLSMLTQTDVKRKLAYSTLGQMGFMMVEFALGLYPLVILHLMGHGFYKAYGFLSSGSREFIPSLPFRSPAYRLIMALGVLILPLSLGLYYNSTEVAMVSLFSLTLIGFLPRRGWLGGIAFIIALSGSAIVLPGIGEWITGVSLNQDYHNSIHSWVGVFTLSSLGFLILSLPVWKDSEWFQTVYCLAQRGFLSGSFSDKFINRVKS